MIPVIGAQNSGPPVKTLEKFRRVRPEGARCYNRRHSEPEKVPGNFKWEIPVYTNWIQSIANSQELSRICDEGIAEYEALSQEERVRFLLIAGSMMRILDDAYRQYTSGRMEQTDWDVYERVIDLAAGSSGFSAYFLQRESLRTTKFVSFIVAKLSAAEKKTESFYK